MIKRMKLYLAILAEPPMPVLLLVSLGAWLVLLFTGNHGHGGEHQYHMGEVAAASLLLQSLWPWFVMLLAMMAPLQAPALRHLWSRSLPRRRLRGIALFAVGYGAVWMGVGAVLVLAAAQLQVYGMGSWLAPLTGGLLVIVWQISPWKQLCLNRCHGVARLSAFGWAADRDCLRFGLVKGFWCVGTCWAFMFLPLLFTWAGLPLMLGISLFLLVEQYQPARPARWRVPLLLTGLSDN